MIGENFLRGAKKKGAKRVFPALDRKKGHDSRNKDSGLGAQAPQGKPDQPAHQPDSSDRAAPVEAVKRKEVTGNLKMKLAVGYNRTIQPSNEQDTGGATPVH